MTHRIEIRIDRRWDGTDEVRAELESLVDTAQGLQVDWTARVDYENAPDAARFRDFAPVATLAHEHLEVLEWATEELVEQFGWRVDVSPMED